jgi:hypothetical protein
MVVATLDTFTTVQVDLQIPLRLLLDGAKFVLVFKAQFVTCLMPAVQKSYFHR